MSVSASAVRIAKTAGNGSTLAFDFAWKIFAAADLTCYKVSAAGVYTLGVLNGSGATGYTVSFDSDAETGTVTWVTAPVSGGFSVIIGDALANTQATAIPREGVLPAETQRNIVDKLTILVQQLTDKLRRVPIQPLTPVNPGAITIDPPEDGKGLRWDDNGDGTFTIVSTDTDADAVTDAAEEAEASASSAASSATAAAASATAAAASAVTSAASASALTTALNLSGAIASRPATPTITTFYWATDQEQLYLYIPAAARWILVA